MPTRLDEARSTPEMSCSEDTPTWLLPNCPEKRANLRLGTGSGPAFRGFGPGEGTGYGGGTGDGIELGSSDTISTPRDARPPRPSENTVSTCPSTKAKLISDAPLRRLLAQFEQEAEFFGRRGDGTMVANVAAAWVRELRQALDQAAREPVTVPVAALGGQMNRSTRTLRRWAKAGKIPGATRRGRCWVVGRSDQRGAA